MKKLLIAMALVAMIAAPIVLADEISEIEATIGKVTNLVSAIGGAIAVLAATVVGVMMFQAKDPSERDQLKERLKYVIVGLVIIVVAPQVVKYILG
jgi:type IV secretory pathway VirB2 component (pilin)